MDYQSKTITRSSTRGEPFEAAVWIDPCNGRIFDPQSQSQDLCPPRVPLPFCTSPASRCPLIIRRHLTRARRLSWNTHVRYREIWFTKEPPPASRTKIGIWTRSLKRIGSRAGKRQVEIDVIRRQTTTMTGRWGGKKRESDYSIPIETYLNEGSYTSNLVSGREEGGEKGTEERLDTRKITCAVYYAFPCNGSIICVFVGGDLRRDYSRSFLRFRNKPVYQNRIRNRSIIFHTCERLFILVYHQEVIKITFFCHEDRDSPILMPR